MVKIASTSPVALSMGQRIQQVQTLARQLPVPDAVLLQNGLTIARFSGGVGNVVLHQVRRGGTFKVTWPHRFAPWSRDCSDFHELLGDTLALLLCCELWRQLGDIPTNEDETLDAPFLDYAPGVSVFELWHDFEAAFPIVLGRDAGGMTTQFDLTGVLDEPDFWAALYASPTATMPNQQISGVHYANHD